ncbi:hypothetical protein E4T42_08127 [Aureobasidium subglaciale]|nr:hypothetical protein E4T42_08127 [Aureobasidium subglaciale]
MQIVPISSLSPSSALPTDCGFKALVTLLWPFSSATGQCALLLADPDARQRYQKGQVRVRFTGPSARQIATSGIGIGDSVQVALVGAQWLTESDTALVKTPGKSVDGELMFKNRLHMTIARGGDELSTISVDESIEPASPKPSMLPPSTPVARNKPRTSFDVYGVAVYSSPAFMKRLHLSEGSTPYSPVPVSEDDDLDTLSSRKRRRVSYKNVSEWKFDAREPSPEKDQDNTMEDTDANDVMVAATTDSNTETAEAEVTQDTTMQDALGNAKSLDGQNQHPDSDAQSSEVITAQPAGETTALDSSVDLTENLSAEVASQPDPTPKPSDVHNIEVGVAQAATRDPDGSINISGRTSQEPQSSEESREKDGMPPHLPRLSILPTESELLEQMARANDVDRPTTPVLQPLLTQGLSLPSPFPTSARKIPSPIFSNPAKDLEAPRQAANQDTATEILNPSNAPLEVLSQLSPIMVSQSQQTAGNGIGEVQEPAQVSEDAALSSDIPQQQVSSESSEAVVQSSRIVPDTYDGLAEETPVVLSSSDESSADAVSDENMQSSSEESEFDEASSAYDSDQIVALQEESDDEGYIEEPDWDYLESKLEQEDAALQESREDLPAGIRGLLGKGDAVMHDSDSELDEEMLARSDDESDEDSDGSGYFDRAVMPGTEDDHSEDSEVEVMDSSYQPSMPENAMYSHPFGTNGAQPVIETKTALPSEAASEEGSAGSDEVAAWRDRDAAVEVLERTVKAPFQDAPPPSSSRLDVVELLDDSESEEEDADVSSPSQPVRVTIDFLPSINLVNQWLDNKEKDAHLELTGPVTAQIRSEIKRISDQAGGQSTKWTKFNALKTICKIGGNVVVAADQGNMFAEGVKYRLKEDEVLVNACWKIYHELADQDKFRTNQAPDMLEHLQELEEKRDYCFEGFSDFLKEFKKNYRNMPLQPQQQQQPPQAPLIPDSEIQSTLGETVQPAVGDASTEQSSGTHEAVDQVDQVDPALADVKRGIERPSSPAVVGFTIKPTVITVASQTASKEQAMVEAIMETTMHPQAPGAQDGPSDAGEKSPPQAQSSGEDVEAQSEDSREVCEEADSDLESVESVQSMMDEHEIDPALLSGEHEIDPTLDDDGQSSPTEASMYEIDPAFSQEEHEIDPALLADGHYGVPSNSNSLMDVDEPMSDIPESEASPFADDADVIQSSVREDELTAEGLSAAQDRETSQTVGTPMKTEIQPSVEVDPELLRDSEVEMIQTQPPLTVVSGTEDLQQVKEELRPLSSSSFKTISPSPNVVEIPAVEASASAIPQDSVRAASQESDQSIEELDLSQVEPAWTSRLSQLSQPRSSRAHTRSETIPDSADEDATDLVAERSDASSNNSSPEPAVQVSPLQTTQKLLKESIVQPSQELGTTLSQFAKQSHGSSGLQSQLPAIEDTASPDEKETADEIRSLVGLDDELLADYVQDVPQSEAAALSSGLQSVEPVISSPASTKKPARPLTLFRGRKSIGLRASVGGDELQAHGLRQPHSENELEQQDRDNEQTMEEAQPQLAADEEMHGVLSRDSKASVAAQAVTGGTSPGGGQVQDPIAPSLVPAAPEISQVQTQAAATVQETTENLAEAQEFAIGQPQISETEHAASNFQIKPTLKPFAEVEASLFGTPLKGKAVTPQEPQSAPSQTWRNTLSSKISEVPVIGSWFTPRRTTVAPKAVTEVKVTTSSNSIFDKTPTKPAAASMVKQTSRDRSISPPPLQRYASQGTSTALSYFTPLAALHEHLNQQSSLIDLVVVCTTFNTTAERAKSGPKDYYTTFRIVDQPLHDYNVASQGKSEVPEVKDVGVEIFRPFKQSLPKASPGDVVLLRGFVVRSRGHKNYLLSTAASGWCVWRYDKSVSTALDYDGPAEEDDRPVWARKGTSQRVGEDGVREEMTGPPVEIGDEEREKVTMVRTWWEELQKDNNEQEKEEHDVIMID